MVLEQLQPKIIWDIFENLICRYPRCSGHEGRIIEEIQKWLQQKAKNLNFSFIFTRDHKGNFLVKKPATSLGSSIPPILIQCHVDMVCETNRPGGFPFETEPLEIQIQADNNWIDAKGTTIGGDNGTGMAIALAILVETDPNFLHGPLEVLFTVEEEIGCNGAKELDVEFLNITSKYLINLDCSYLGVIAIGSAGFGTTTFFQEFTKISTKPQDEFAFIELEVRGLKSGHSGIDIHLPRLNANVLISEFLSSLNKTVDVFLCSWNGGKNLNVIPSHSKCSICLKSEDFSIFLRKFQDFRSELEKNNIIPSQKWEPNLQLSWKEVEKTLIFSKESTDNILGFVNNLPHGVVDYSPITISNIQESLISCELPQIHELVQSSNNFAQILTKNEKMTIKVSTRSSLTPKLEVIYRKLEQLGNMGGWKMLQTEPDPAWEPNIHSPLALYVKDEYTQLLNNPPLIFSIHGGLETAYIGKKLSSIQMVSIGTTVEMEHTPEERISIPHMAIFYPLFKKILQNFKNINHKRYCTHT